MARRINDTFGPDSIAVSVYTPWSFIRMYDAAERARGVTPPFSPATNTLLAWEERRYVTCDAVARCGGT